VVARRPTWKGTFCIRAASRLGSSSADGVANAVSLKTSRSPRLRAPVRVQHHAQDAVDAEPGMPEVGVSAMRMALAAYFFPNGSKANFWPPTLASNMRPPLPVVKTATPFSYLALADASFAAATALA